MVDKSIATDFKTKSLKSIVYINMFYPYDFKGETFLATEIDYMVSLGHVQTNKYIFPIWANRKRQKIVNLDGFKVIGNIPDYSKFKKILWCLLALLDSELYKETALLMKSKRLNLKNLIKLVGFIGQGNYMSSKLEEYISQTVPLGTEITLYSYWMHLQAYIAVKVSKKLSHKYKIKSISRCHRFDVYEYAANNYIPLRNYILNGLDIVYPISTDATDYINTNYSIDKSKLEISRLGTVDKGLRISPKGKCLKILSCSWMRPVKRNGLIFEALKELDFEVEWTHIGDGDEFENIKNEIMRLKNKNIRCKLLGSMNNDQVIEYYRTHDFNVFVNVSRSEGVPVSIMEAMAFGKVIIATDVGGTKEVVISERNGFLMPVELSPQELGKKFRTIYQMSEQKYKELCQESRDIWEELFNAETNYKKFNIDLLKGNPK
ncbi:glycosyltransferase [Peribacillus frigoritolerans]|uniref:glycosyltransferase n=1 Tax=Peribacillus frigoritolerans TaxID=450367 RepID=UPI002B24F115|nr:glycosyltransferase [Peribacillus frigoritolerans]MEB2629678.1 glycosyltransferase [Peribacillus frigoritolerans]